MAKVLTSGLGFALVGALAIFIAIGHEMPAQPTTSIERNQFNAWLLLERIGETLIVIGLLDVMVHLPNWNEYFLDNIKDSIVQDAYLRKLDSDALKELVSRAFQAQLKNPAISIDKEGSFLTFFFTDIHSLIGSAYREDVHSEVTCREDDADHFMIEDNLTYICRAAGSVIQESVKWSNEPQEIADVRTIKIFLMKSGSAEKVLFASETDFQYVYYDESTGNEEPPGTLDHSKRLKYSFIERPLGAHRNDGLIVIIQAVYRVRRDRFQYWTMSHPTKNFSLSLRFPRNHEVQFAPFSLNESKTVITQSQDCLTMRYLSWMLPNSGIAWRFNKIAALPVPGAAAAAGSASVAETAKS